MTKHPYRLALGLAACTVTGLTAMMVVDGVADYVCLALATAPAAAGAVAFVRQQTLKHGSPGKSTNAGWARHSVTDVDD